MTGYLTTHVLDIARGLPAAGLKILLYKVTGMNHRKLVEMVTNADGQTDGPILPVAKFAPGVYELVFCAGEYLRGAGLEAVEPIFLDEIPIRFGMNDAAAHYHVPLLLSPYGYSTYRGS